MEWLKKVSVNCITFLEIWKLADFMLIRLGDFPCYISEEVLYTHVFYLVSLSQGCNLRMTGQC